MTASSGEKSHVTIGETHSIFGDAVWTQQSGGCGEQGDQIYASYSSVGRASFGKELVREWAKFRYGVFDERGFAQDPVYPKCFLSDRTEVTGCSDTGRSTLAIGPPNWGAAQPPRASSNATADRARFMLTLRRPE